MGRENQPVEIFLAALEHPQKDVIQAVRRLIQQAAPELQEGIKWNAPSYVLDGRDIITFNFRNFGGIALIFHTGPHGKDTHAGVHPWSDVFSNFTWVADNRGVLRVPDRDFLEGSHQIIHELVTRWVSLARRGFQQ